MSMTWFHSYLLLTKTCNDADDGLIAASVTSGGTSPFSYQWDDINASATSTVSPVVAGLYHVTITDIRGCVLIDSIEVTEPTAITIDTLIGLPGCINMASGGIQVEAHGGVPPYTYLWPADGVNGPTRTGLTAGEYTRLRY